MVDGGIRMSRVNNRIFGTQSSQDRHKALIRRLIKIWNVPSDLQLFGSGSET